MGLERRQVLRLSKAYQEQGATALISKKRGRASNRQTPMAIKGQALELIRARYADFGPTLAAEKLREVHGITIGRETLRRKRCSRATRRGLSSRDAELISLLQDVRAIPALDGRADAVQCQPDEKKTRSAGYVDG
jgi:hypothetical protein